MLFSIVILTLWKKQRFRELRYLTAGHPASKWQSQVADSICQISNPVPSLLYHLDMSQFSASHFKGNKPAKALVTHFRTATIFSLAVNDVFGSDWLTRLPQILKSSFLAMQHVRMPSPPSLCAWEEQILPGAFSPDPSGIFF